MSQRKGGDEHAPVVFQHFLEIFLESIQFGLPSHALWSGPFPSGGFQNQNIGLHVSKASPPQNGLILKTDISAVEEGFVIRA